MAWITPAMVKSRIADRLSKDIDKLPPKWDGICADADNAGYSDLVSRLRLKGYTQAQLDMWDDRVRYNVDQALYWALVNGGVGAGYDDKEINKLDHRGEIDKDQIAVMIGGAIVLPGETGQVGGSVHGGDIAMGFGNVSGASTFRTQRD